MKTERDTILEILIRIYGEERVTHYDHLLDVSVKEIHVCYDELSAHERDLVLTFSGDGQLEDIMVD